MLKLASGPTLPKVFGILVLIAVALSVLGLRIEASFLSLVLGGGAAGVMGTMVGIHGPPIALVFQHARPDIARAMLGAFFGFAYVGTVVALAAVGLFGRPELSLAAMLLPGVVAGLLVAPFIAERIDRRRLRYAILLISASSGAILLLRCSPRENVRAINAAPVRNNATPIMRAVIVGVTRTCTRLPTQTLAVLRQNLIPLG